MSLEGMRAAVIAALLLTLIWAVGALSLPRTGQCENFRSTVLAFCW